MISVIIPVYNAALYLNRCLDSLLAQTFEDWEAICVDDGSTDSSLSILEEYSRKDKRFRIFSQENGGAGKVRNEGLKKAVGEYIFFMDSDDELVLNCLETLWKEVELHPDVEMVVGANKTIVANGISRIETMGESCYIDNNKFVRLQFFRIDTQFSVVPWNKLIKRTFLIDNEAVRFKEGVICEDEYWAYYLYKNINCVSVLENVTYIHHLVPTSVMSTSDRQTRAKALFIVINDLIKDFDSPMRTLQVYKYLEYYRNYIHNNISIKDDKWLHFWFCKELFKQKHFKIAFFWAINWYYKYRQYRLYNVLLVNVYRNKSNYYLCCLESNIK